MSYLILSERGGRQALANACAHDLEDLAIDLLSADLLTPTSGTGHLKASYDGALIVSIGQQSMSDLLKALLPTVRDRINGPIMGYLFGAYGARVKNTRHLFRSIIGPRRTPLSRLDCLFLGIRDDAEFIGHMLNVPTQYIPMAANMRRAAPRHYRPPAERPICIAAFGRQKDEIASAFNARFNSADSDQLFLSMSFLDVQKSAMLSEYRRFFWHSLRNSRLSTAFDHFYTSPDTAKLSYVGPRWFESLAAGTVVIGRAPTTPDRAELLDWEDALIELDDDPAAATEQAADLLTQEERLDAISRRNLGQMYRRHDWGHRLVHMLNHLGQPEPARLTEHLAALDQSADALAGAPQP